MATTSQSRRAVTASPRGTRKTAATQSSFGADHHTGPPPPGRSLPRGPCNYRELSSGPQAPCCGCERFYVSQDVHGSRRPYRVGDGDPWCICGHHGCFHSIQEQPNDHGGRAQGKHSAQALPEGAPVYVQLLHPTPDGRFQMVAGSQPVCLKGLDNGQGLGIVMTTTTGRADERIPGGDGRVAAGNTTSRFHTPSFTSINPLYHSPAGSQPFPKTDTSGFPPLPSQCVLPEGLDRYFDPTEQGPSRQHGSSEDRLSEVMRHRSSPSRAFLQHVIDSRRYGPPLDVPVSLPNTADDLLQSATEVIPSTKTTPDLRSLDQTVQDAQALTQNLTKDMTIATAAGYLTDSTEVVEGNDRGFASPPCNSSDLARTALHKISADLQKLVPHLASLHGHLTSYPNVFTSISDLAARVDALENASFSHVPAEEIHERFELQDTRLIEIEGRLETHDKWSEAVQSDRDKGVHGSRASVTGSSLVSMNSFGSVRSRTSAPPGASPDRSKTETRLEEIEERVGVLESASLPSYANPWEIEIVFLPWGRDLKGVWFSPDDPGHHSSKMTTQESEEWTPAQGLLGSLHSHPLSEHSRTGWSSPAIHHWANNTDEWLSPRACGPNGLVYKRIRSRGLVRSVIITNPGSKEILSAIGNAFSGLAEVLSGPDDSHADTSPPSYLGLDSLMIPLRKVHKSSRLHFLGPSEMVTPTTWTAEFLASIMMRAAGGQKRLYMTHRPAYLQQGGDNHRGWSWQRLRELPRFRAANDHASGVGGDHVAEADAKEACWAHNPSYDPPTSAVSSFCSNASGCVAHDIPPGQSAVPPSQASDVKGPSRVSPVAVYSQPPPPISPLSEFASLRPARMRRTNSVPSGDASNQAAAQLPKRRIASFEQSAQAAPPSPSKSGKRRRMTRSPEGDASARLWTFTPRRSKEPPSPFPTAERVPSDGRSQGTAALPVGKGMSTPFAYATPHSGPAFTDQYEGGDTEVEVDESEHEDVWEGVEDVEAGNGGRPHPPPPPPRARVVEAAMQAESEIDFEDDKISESEIYDEMEED